MKIMHESEVSISGFASVRERVVLQSRAFFRQQPEAASFDEFGSLIYLANAWFSARGATGLHHHQDLDIVSVIPRGAMLHQGSIGNDIVVPSAHVQIQRSGLAGFSHNEINPNDEPQSFLQMWFRPQHPADSAEYQLVDASQLGAHSVYQSFQTRLSVLNLAAESLWQSPYLSLIFVYSGQAELSNQGEIVELQRGSLVKLAKPQLRALTACHALVFEEIAEINNA